MKRRGQNAVVETLRDLRGLRGMTQAGLAEVLGISQGALSRLERRSDVRLATLRGFVEGLGGELALVARFRDREVTIDLPFDPAPVSR